MRELENAIESLVALSQGNELDLSLLPSPTAAVAATPPAPSAAAAAPVAATAAALSDGGAQFDLKARVDAYERGIIVSALEAAHGNRSLTARNLGINRATLHGKLRKYGLSDSDTDLDELERIGLVFIVTDDIRTTCRRKSRQARGAPRRAPTSAPLHDGC